MSVTVRVALRVRPFNEREKENKSQHIISYIPQDEKQQQIQIMDQDRRRHFFTFDHVYDPNISQANVYQSCIQPLFDQFIKGYNATVLAYGQTGSGKTYSMGTSINIDIKASQEQDGIVPRFTRNLFNYLEKEQQDQDKKKYQVKVSFLELYNEDIIDLLNPNKTATAVINIRQDTFGNISWSGVHDQVVLSSADLLNCLYQGSIARTTGSTDMNSESSRSHAIFSVTLIQSLSTTTVTTSKFHFVDLAGSERLKRTNAKGDRAKEGISINSGLLALGNVISALGDEKKKQPRKNNNSHVPYRNSKLTRLLQDSLGGNSQTLMLACVSSSDLNINETLSTLKYANRAKNITNRVVINQELSEVDTMKQEISRLKQELQINDAFMKEVHLELDDLRAQNLALTNGMPKLETETSVLARSQQEQQTKLPFLSKHHKKNASSMTTIDDDDDATLVGGPMASHTSTSSSKKPSRSTSTKRRKKNQAVDNSHKKETSSTTKGTTISFLDKHKNRTRKESLFIKQIKSNKDASSDPVLFMKLVTMFQSSIREQKQLLHHIEQQQGQASIDIKVEKSTSTKKKSIPAAKASLTATTTTTTTTATGMKRNSNKPSLMKQPNTISLQNNKSNSSSDGEKETTHHRLTFKVEENQTSSTHLKQIVIQVKKAVSILSTVGAENSLFVQQLKPILNKMTAICSSTRSTTTTTTKSSEVVVVKKAAAKRPVPSMTTMSKRVDLDDLLREMKRYTALENIKTSPICTEMTKSIKQKKLKLIREQKDLIKERKLMLNEFYPDEVDYADQQQKQQYMDERIDIITVQVDYLSEQLKLLQPTIHSKKVEKSESLMEMLKPLKEQEIRSLLWSLIQHDLMSYSMTNELYQLTENVLGRYQQAMIQLRRDNTVKMNHHILMNLLNSAPCKCLSNGLILLNTVNK